eukprot:4065287-Amphidinium_carterae.1
MLKVDMKAHHSASGLWRLVLSSEGENSAALHRTRCNNRHIRPFGQFLRTTRCEAHMHPENRACSRGESEAPEVDGFTEVLTA